MMLNIRRLATNEADFDARFHALLHWSSDTDAAIEQRVADIIADVRARGDAAVLDATARFDGLTAKSVADLEVPRAEWDAALAGLAPELRLALESAARRVHSYHARQLEACGRSWSFVDEDGSRLGQKVTPLDRVGIYVPGGKAAYPSSVLMNAIPAQVAGVGESDHCAFGSSLRRAVARMRRGRRVSRLSAVERRRCRRATRVRCGR